MYEGWKQNVKRWLSRLAVSWSKPLVEKKGKRRVDGRFIAFPHAVLLSQSYLALSHTARSLLFEIALQYMGENNGQMLASQNKLRPRGWKSADTLHRAKAELLAAGFVVETVKGGRPNKASWYAVTWWKLDSHPRYDEGVQLAFRLVRLPWRNSRVTPAHGAQTPATAPNDSRPSPRNGAMRLNQTPPPTPPDGEHLEAPSHGSDQGDAPKRAEAAAGCRAHWKVANG